MKNSFLILGVAIITLLSCTTSKSATNITPIGKWEKLGSKKVNFKLDRDVIKVGTHEGSFKKLKIEVTGGDVNMRKMIVEYKNGQKETINLKYKFSARTGSRVIDLKGNNRVIKDITFWYDSVNKRGGKATIHVFGKH